MRSATPPSVPDAGLGRMKAASLTESRSMRVLSPRIEPPDTLDDGSIASTATRCPRSIRSSPSASMKVDLPTPGTPEMPRRIACRCRQARRAARRRAPMVVPVDSSSVIALATARRCAARAAVERVEQASCRRAAVAPASRGDSDARRAAAGRVRRTATRDRRGRLEAAAASPGIGGGESGHARQRRAPCGSARARPSRSPGSACPGRRCP